MGAAFAVLATVLAPVVAAPVQAAGVPAGFRDSVVLSGLSLPTNVTFASDGRVFVAEKRGTIQMFDDLADTTPTQVVDLRADVFNASDSGLTGLTLDPAFPTKPYLYITYQHDAPPGGTAPTWGSATSDFDDCPRSYDICAKLGRVERLTLQGSAVVARRLLMADSCQGSNAHAIDEAKFGPDGALYISTGDGASANTGLGGGAGDYGQRGNVCGDPPVPAGTNQTLPSSEGGALRSQDYRTTAEPMGTAGTLVRIDPATGAPFPGNPGLATSSDINVQRTIAYGLRNPFRFDFRPGSNEVYLGDVGWNSVDELNVVADRQDAVVENFGWPCYEGPNRSSVWDGLDVTMCEKLYTEN